MLPRKSIRLPATEYEGTQTYFITICCHHRRNIFKTIPQGKWAIGHLVQSAAKHAFLLHAYCVMPNHIHILAEAAKKSCNLSKFISHFKQTTAYFYKQKTNEPLWQPRYYDHILRNPKDTEPIAQYIWQNPIRKGLCQNPRDYQLSGSQTINWKEYCSAPTDWSPPWKPFHRPIQNTSATV